MIDLGTVRPGSTIRIPFATFDKDDGSSITMTNFAVADILIYKDGSTTERASTSGYTATTDFDSKTGRHLIVIDLADNSTADFFAAGSEYLVAIDAVTVDAVTVGAWVARFRIGYADAILDTTIATLASQTSFTLTTGPAEDDALNGLWAVIHDAASAVQLTWVQVLDYTGSTKTVTLAAAGKFTVAAKDNISFMNPAPLQPTATGDRLTLTSGAVNTTSNVKRNQALAGFSFLMTDATSHLPATGKTVTVTRSIDGGAFAAGTLANLTELSNGLYTVDFAIGDLDGKVVILRATATGCDDTFERIITQP
jgi:hypothetical protein